MERLKAAIEQARKTRESNVATTPPPVAPQSDSQPGKAAQPAPKQRGGVLNDAATEFGAKPMDPDVQERWDALELATLKPGRMRRNRLVTEGKKHAEAAAYDMLRTRLLTITEKEGWRRVAITSPTMSCGKSTTTLNLALSLAKLADVRTLVIEADMRRPSMAKMLGVRGTHSFSDVLAGRVDIADQAIRIAPNVAVSLNHSARRGSAELLRGHKTPKILEMIEKSYQPDIVLFDMPPMMQSDDTLGFIKNVDCAMLIALADTTTLAQVDFCESELAAQTNVAGVVLNRCRYSGAGYGYGYGEY